jgi:hypothetical protein
VRRVERGEPFRFVRSYVVGMPTGARLRDARDLLEAARTASDRVLEQHLLHCYLRPEFEVSGYPNDFAIWAAEALEDLPLAEALSGIDPFRCEDWDHVREEMTEVIEDDLWEDPGLRHVRPGRELFLEESITVVVETGGVARNLEQLRKRIAVCQPSAIYHHVHRACSRQREANSDFSNWVEQSLGLADLAREIDDIDFPYYTLEQLRWVLLDLLDNHADAPEVRS